MSFVYNERPSESSFVEAVWRTEDKTDGLYRAPADGRWDLTFINQDGQTKVLLSGPSSRMTPVLYKQGNRNFGIRFRPSSFMPHLPAARMLDVTEELPVQSRRTFWFAGQTWELPTFDNADVFLQKLAQHGLLDCDPVVEHALTGQDQLVSTRSVQRHFLRTTGMTPHYLGQIARAQQALELLRTGRPIAQVVYELGYADQPHMTRVLKRLTGQTPAQISQAADTS